MKIDHKTVAAALLVAVGALAAGTARAEGDAAAGAKVFKKCATCHTLAKGARHKIGPNLYGLFDRKAGKAPGFRYSKRLAAADFAWDDERLDAWLANPRKVIKGTRMSFRLHKARDRADVIAYLRQAARE